MDNSLRMRAYNAGLRLFGNRMVVNEHFVPALGLELAPYLERGDTTAVHHLLRYQWAAAVLRDRPPATLLDVACGAGYGSAMLAAALPAAQILGADYDPAAVKRAIQDHASPRVRFVQGDVHRWRDTIGHERFDCVVSFDTLEHSEHREIFLENLVNHLNPDGRLLLSTPCGHDVNELKPRWLHHAIEYSSASLYDFLRRYFAVVRRPEDADFPHRKVFDQLVGSKVTYLLQMNPVLCEQPIQYANPYRAA
ncbi:MAG: class I SAM-dependent methyltransferase [Caldilineaceae bacterium]